jgi:hypothetical protein
VVVKLRSGRKKTERPRTCTEPIQKAPTHLVFFSPDLLFLIDFSGVSQQVEVKTTSIVFCFDIGGQSFLSGAGHS